MMEFVNETSPHLVPSSSDSSLKENAIKCRICERSYDGSQHFGIDICRACAAFFRRSSSVKKSFVCRRGTDNCHLNTPRKITCQKCRWKRCLQVGLQIELVNGHRSPPHNTKHHAHHSSKHELDYDYDSADGSDSFDESPAAVHIFRPKPLQMTLDIEKSHTNFIQKVLANYREFSQQRLDVEQQFPMTKDQEVVLNGRVMYKTTRRQQAEIYKRQLPLFHTFLLNTFGIYKQSSTEEQKRICALVYPVLWEIEACYWSFRFLSKEAAADKIMLTQTTFIDVNDVKHWTEKECGTSEDACLEGVLKNLMQDTQKLVLNPMHSLIISEVEFAVLLSLNIWAPRNHRISEESDRLAAEMRSKIFDDVHILYRHEMKMDNYAKRMGDLMCLYTDVQAANISSSMQSIFFPEIREMIYSA